MELSPESGFLLPGYLQGRHRFVLHVNVTPVNDPPNLELGMGKVLRLAQVGQLRKSIYYHSYCSAFKKKKKKHFFKFEIFFFYF